MIKCSKQKYMSKNTSINSTRVPAIFKLVDFNPNTINLDYGGGKFDIATEYLKSINVTNLIYDPYNRDSTHNDSILRIVREHGGVDTVTLSNVLNVIEEDYIRLEILQNIKNLMKPNGVLYVTVYEGNRSGVGNPTQNGKSYQANKSTKLYIDEIKNVFSNVTLKGKLIIACN